MKLAFDSSQRAGSLALWDDGRVIYSACFDINITHSETLMPQIDHAVAFCGFKPADIGAVLITLGPGSFTGLRIGLATAKGICYGLKIPLLTFSTLQLAALARYNCGHKILAVLDAKMKEVYAALYDPLLGELVAPRVCDPAELCGWDLDTPFLTGSGAGIALPVLSAAGIACRTVPEQPLSAAGLFTLAELFPQPEVYDLEKLTDLMPDYLRDATAQLNKQKKNS